MMRTSLFIGILLTVLAGAACTRHYAIEDRARQQIVISVEDELEGIFPNHYDARIEDLKTVYVNDSICLLQCTARCRDGNGEKRMRDYRYIYLVDTFESRMAGKPVFKEQFRNILHLPDDLIRQCRKDVKESGESVYESCVNATLPVHKPFDAPAK